MQNVCKLVSCPFLNPKDNSCTRYSVSNHCHLLWMNRNRRKGLYKRIYANQYALYIDNSNSTIRFLKRQNQHFLRNSDYYANSVQLHNAKFGKMISNPNQDYPSKRNEHPIPYPD